MQLMVSTSKQASGANEMQDLYNSASGQFRFDSLLIGHVLSCSTAAFLFLTCSSQVFEAH